MNRLSRGILTATTALAVCLPDARSAWAQMGEGTSAEALAEPPEPEPSFWEGGGLKLGENTFFHPRFELGTAFQTNVFSADDSDTRPYGRGTGAVGAPIFRLGVGGSLATRPESRMELQPGGTARRAVILRGDVDLTWNQYISDNNEVSEASDLAIGLLFDARFNPDGEFMVVLKDGLTRAVRPPPAESLGDVDRIKNDFTLGGVYKPGGGAIQGYANYIFGADIFEKSRLNFGNRLSHTFNLGGRWQWLPKTQFTADFFLGFISPNDTTVKAASMPMRIWAGISTLITPTFGTVVKLGYGNGFYDRGPSFSSYLALVEGRWALGPVARFAFGYAHDFADALIGNYYTDHAFYARVAAQFGGRWQARARGEIRLRDYDGIVDFGGVNFCPDDACMGEDRFDVLARVEATVEYQINAWLYGGAGYTFESVTTDFFINEGGDLDSAGYVWNEFLIRATARF
jgi:hypothetical protein